MNQIIESLKRLYHGGLITDATLNTLLLQGAISKEAKEYIQKEEGDK